MSRLLEVRRHSYTKKGEKRGRGSHLSPEGVQLARQLGNTIGPFALVVASDVPRTLETALAMGFAVDELLPFGQDLNWDAVIEEMGWHALWDQENPFAHISQVLDSRPHTSQMGQQHRYHWLNIANSVPDGESALVISHGLVMEVTLVVAFPLEDHASWGPPFSHCEGVRLQVERGEFSSPEFLRINVPDRAARKGTDRFPNGRT